MYNAQTRGRHQIGQHDTPKQRSGGKQIPTLPWLRSLALSSSLLILGGCAIGNAVDYQSATQRQVQSQHILQWKGCIDREMSQQLSGGNSPDAAYQNTAVRCQGERRDVLASYPLRLEQPVGDMLTEHLQQRTAGHIVRTAARR